MICLVAPAAEATPPATQPNGMIKRGAASDDAADYKGADIYNHTAKGQTVTVRSNAGHKVKLSMRFRNDGSAADDLLTKGCRSNHGIKYSYAIPDLLNPGGWTDVTSEVIAGLVATGVAPGDGLPIRVIAKIPRGITGGSWWCKMGVTSGGDSSMYDIVEFKIVVR